MKDSSAKDPQGLNKQTKTWRKIRIVSSTYNGMLRLYPSHLERFISYQLCVLWVRTYNKIEKIKTETFCLSDAL